MKVLPLLMALLCSFPAFADIHQAPPAFALDATTQAVFVDFKSAQSTITYDLDKREAAVTTTIVFEQENSGKPIFDLVETPSAMTLNGQAVESRTTSMNGVSTVRYVDKALSAGTYTLVIHTEIAKNISWSSNYVKSAFWTSDLSDRRYLEQYLPTNLEYDQYKSDLDVKVINTQTEHVLYANGEMTEIAPNHWKVSYPATYTTSSYFFHLSKKGLMNEQNATYQSIDGRSIPVTVYSNQSTSRYMTKALGVLAELENDYGPFPHQKVIIYGAGSGGMEYCGATMTSYSALDHELTHSYFARGVMPANGNAGWIDEAIASWRDNNYTSYSSRSLSRTDMAGHSVYERTTDMDAYTKGMRFMGYLNDRFQNKEGFKVFLKNFFTERKFKPYKTQDFQKAVEDFYNTSLTDEFNTYIYGKNGIDANKSEVQDNPYHPHLTEQQLFDLL